ncbi:MAG: hypothetical protein HFF50_07895 [Lawsonibacter sp.]|nr:hypothetical protein [Lawsonibacter sp.]
MDNRTWIPTLFGVAAVGVMLAGGGGMWKVLLELLLLALCVVTNWLLVRCPRCRKWLGLKHPRYCPHCGAYIDW